MMGDTLTEENLKTIKEAMDKIKEIDRSDWFKLYYSELDWRLNNPTKARPAIYLEEIKKYDPYYGK